MNSFKGTLQILNVEIQSSSYFPEKERTPLKIDFEEIQLPETETTILSCSEKLCENPV